MNAYLSFEDLVAYMAALRQVEGSDGSWIVGEDIGISDEGIQTIRIASTATSLGHALHS